MSSSDALIKANELLQSGKRADAFALLEALVQNDPHNLKAWSYYVKACPDDIERIRALEMCLDQNPDNAKVQEMLSILKTRQSQLSPASTTPIDPINAVLSQVHPASEKTNRLFQPLVLLVFLGMLCLVVWQTHNVDLLTKRLQAVEAEIGSTQTEITSISTQLAGPDAISPSRIGALESDVSGLKSKWNSIPSSSRIDTLEANVTKLQAKVDEADSAISAVADDLSSLTDTVNYNANASNSAVRALASDLSSLSSTVNHNATVLDDVARVANNANRYAHSHNSYSDIRLKENVASIEHPLEKVLKLNGITFTWDPSKSAAANLGDGPQIGLIAQQVEQIFPELVSIDAQGYKIVNYDGLIPVLVEAIKEQQAMIMQLQQDRTAVH